MDLNDLLRSFKRLYALDTNTWNLSADKISVASPLEAWFIGQKVYIRHFPSLELRNVAGSPEHMAWRLFIKARCRAGDDDENARIGLIVDAEVSLLSGINTCLIPVNDKFFLPDNFEIIYATSDGGREMIVNRLIDACEKRGENLLQEICSNLENTKMLKTVKSECFSHKRWWPGETLDS